MYVCMINKKRGKKLIQKTPLYPVKLIDKIFIRITDNIALNNFKPFTYMCEHWIKKFVFGFADWYKILKFNLINWFYCTKFAFYAALAYYESIDYLISIYGTCIFIMTQDYSYGCQRVYSDYLQLMHQDALVLLE